MWANLCLVEWLHCSFDITIDCTLQFRTEYSKIQCNVIWYIVFLLLTKAKTNAKLFLIVEIIYIYLIKKKNVALSTITTKFCSITKKILKEMAILKTKNEKHITFQKLKLKLIN